MGRRRGTAILKRQREVKKAEKQALKREKREQRKDEDDPTPDTATAEDMAAYGFVPPEDEESLAQDPEPGD